MIYAIRAGSVAVLLGLLAGCGAGSPAIDSGGTAGAGTASGGAASGGAADGGTALVIRYTAAAGEAAVTWRLRCSPPGGDHPDPVAACAALDRSAAKLEPVPDGSMCTELYGGPQTATVTGTVRGREVQAELSRTDGCQISRWEALTGLLPAPTSAAG